MGLNLTLGYAGQISLAQASFMAIGAYTTALLMLAGAPWVIGYACRRCTLSFVVGLAAWLSPPCGCRATFWRS